MTFGKRERREVKLLNRFYSQWLRNKKRKVLANVFLQVQGLSVYVLPCFLYPRLKARTKFRKPTNATRDHKIVFRTREFPIVDRKFGNEWITKMAIPCFPLWNNASCNESNYSTIN